MVLSASLLTGDADVKNDFGVGQIKDTISLNHFWFEKTLSWMHKLQTIFKQIASIRPIFSRKIDWFDFFSQIVKQTRCTVTQTIICRHTQSASVNVSDPKRATKDEIFEKVEKARVTSRISAIDGGKRTVESDMILMIHKSKSARDLNPLKNGNSHFAEVSPILATKPFWCLFKRRQDRITLCAYFDSFDDYF